MVNYDLSVGVNLAHYPREETISLLAVLLPVCSAFIFIFQQWYSGNVSDENRNKKWREKCCPAILAAAGNQPYAPPQNCLSEVIWMSCVSPQTPLDKLLFARCLVCEMHSELLIANQFKHKASYPNRKTDEIKPNQCIVS